MPMLPKAEKKRIYLPSTDKPNVADDQKIYIDYKTSISVADLSVYDATTTEIDNALRILSQVIVGWNITDEAGATLPINPNTLGQLPSTDLQTLIAIVEEVTPDMDGVTKTEKKT